MKDERTEAEVIRDAYAPEHLLKRAPVQGYGGGIPWGLHLEAYEAYSKKWGRQTALINLAGRGCRGGFATGELDDFIPGWRDKVSAATVMQNRLIAANALLREAADHIVGATGALEGSDSADITNRVEAFLQEQAA